MYSCVGNGSKGGQASNEGVGRESEWIGKEEEIGRERYYTLEHVPPKYLHLRRCSLPQLS